MISCVKMFTGCGWLLILFVDGLVGWMDWFVMVVVLRICSAGVWRVISFVAVVLF